MILTIPKSILVILTIALAICTSGCTKKTESPNTMKLGLMPGISCLPFLIAQQEGFFNKYGAKISFVNFNSGMDRDAAIIGKSIDAVDDDYFSTATYIKSGLKMKIILDTDENFGLLTGKDSNVKSVTDLKGKTIMYSKNTVIEYVMDKMLEQNNMSAADTIGVVVPVLPTRMLLLESGKDDAAILPEPFISIALADGVNLIKNSSDMGINATVISVTDVYYLKNKDNITKIISAYNDAVDILNSKEGEARYEQYIIKTLGYPQTSVRNLNLPKFKKAHVPEVGSFNDAMKWAKEKGLSDSLLKYDDTVATDLIKK